MRTSIRIDRVVVLRCDALEPNRLSTANPTCAESMVAASAINSLDKKSSLHFVRKDREGDSVGTNRASRIALRPEPR